MPIINSEIGDRTVIRQSDLVNIYNAKIGDDCMIAAFVEIGNATIGNNCRIQAFVFIPEGITIGDNVFIGPGTKFMNDKYPPSTIINTVVEDNAVIGGGAVILPGITIASGSRIGAGAVVTSDTGNENVYVGVPARERQMNECRVYAPAF